MPSETYCETTDLLIGDLQLGANVLPQNYVNSAADEINGRLGLVYVLPIDKDALDEAGNLVLKKMNTFLASGRLIMAVAIGGEDAALQAYGLSLVQDAFNELALILNGQIVLVGIDHVPNSGVDTAPFIKNAGTASGFDAYELEFYSDLPGGFARPPRFPDGAIWRPRDES